MHNGFGIRCRLVGDSMIEQHDVIVVGAGPAGTLLVKFSGAAES